MPKCLPGEIKSYVAKHLLDDAENHLSMTTEDYRTSHSVMWGLIDWETWVKLMKTQANYSNRAAELVESLPSCPKETYYPLPDHSPFAA